MGWLEVIEALQAGGGTIGNVRAVVRKEYAPSTSSRPARRLSTASYALFRGATFSAAGSWLPCHGARFALESRRDLDACVDGLFKTDLGSSFPRRGSPLGVRPDGTLHVLLRPGESNSVIGVAALEHQGAQCESKTSRWALPVSFARGRKRRSARDRTQGTMQANSCSRWRSLAILVVATGFPAGCSPTLSPYAVSTAEGRLAATPPPVPRVHFPAVVSAPEFADYQGTHDVGSYYVVPQNVFVAPGGAAIRQAIALLTSGEDRLILQAVLKPADSLLEEARALLTKGGASPTSVVYYPIQDAHVTPITDAESLSVLTWSVAPSVPDSTDGAYRFLVVLRSQGADNVVRIRRLLATRPGLALLSAGTLQTFEHGQPSTRTVATRINVSELSITSMTR